MLRYSVIVEPVENILWNTTGYLKLAPTPTAPMLSVKTAETMDSWLQSVSGGFAAFPVL